MDNYYSFVFKGLLTEEALDKAGRKSKAIFTDLQNIELEKRLYLDLVDESILNVARKMAIVFTTIFAFENTVRDFISKKLIEELKEEYWTKGVPEKIRKKAEARKAEEDKIKWHNQRGDNLINFTDFGDFISIFHQNWVMFEPHLTSIEWVSHIFRTLERSRNVIMHSGVLSQTDIERVGTMIRDWYNQTGI
jgi:hypothetical protein